MQSHILADFLAKFEPADERAKREFRTDLRALLLWVLDDAKEAMDNDFAAYLDD